jgi:hypothetical protein
MHRSLAEHLAEVRRAIPTKDRAPLTEVEPTAPITTDLTEYRPLTSEERFFLVQRGGRLIGLELYDIEGLDRTFGFPDVATLYTFGK